MNKKPTPRKPTTKKVSTNQASTKKPATYNPPHVDADKIRADLSRNENLPLLEQQALQQFAWTSRRVAQYPDASKLQAAIGQRHGVSPRQVVITCGGDEAIDRTVRVCLADRDAGQRKILTHHPTFEMFNVYADASGGELIGPDWFDQAFPLDDFVGMYRPDVALVALVSPNNPTARTIPLKQLKQAVRSAEEQGLHVLVDLAYVEFAEHDPTEWILENSRAVMIRSFSKAFGMAGLRLGYALTSDVQMADRLRNVAGPFPTSQASLDLGWQALCHPHRLNEIVNQTRAHRRALLEMLAEAGIAALPSDANFVLAISEDAERLHERLLECGVAVRLFPDKPLLRQCLRVTVPRTRCELGMVARALDIASPRSFIERDRTTMNLTSETASRIGEALRETRETQIRCQIDLDAAASPLIKTGLGFLDHMLTALAVHGGFALELECRGDLHVDDHHTVEDCGLVVGMAVDQALGPRQGIARYGWALVPMDEALAQVAIDLSGRPVSVVNMNFTREKLGDVATENLAHFFQSLAVTLKCALHVDVLRGDNDHHKCEAAFKALAKALAQATRASGNHQVPSTKGVL